MTMSSPMAPTRMRRNDLDTPSACAGCPPSRRHLVTTVITLENTRPKPSGWPIMIDRHPSSPISRPLYGCMVGLHSPHPQELAGVSSRVGASSGAIGVSRGVAPSVIVWAMLDAACAEDARAVVFGVPLSHVY